MAASATSWTMAFLDYVWVSNDEVKNSEAAGTASVNVAGHNFKDSTRAAIWSASFGTETSSGLRTWLLENPGMSNVRDGEVIG
jgi:hypothetical protein